MTNRQEYTILVVQKVFMIWVFIRAKLFYDATIEETSGGKITKNVSAQTVTNFG